MAENTTIARPYAQAIVSLAKESDTLQKWSEMLALLTAATTDAAMAEFIANPNVSDADRIAVISDVCGEQIDASGQEMLRVLAENGRLGVLADITRLFQIEKAKAEGTITAQVISARELTSAQTELLSASLQKRLGRDVTIKCEVDASLLGGAIIRAGDLVIDGSAAGKLNRLSANLLH